MENKDNCIISFYSFTDLTKLFDKIYNLEAFQKHIKNLCIQENVFGTIFVANEGVNGSINGKMENLEKILQFITEKGVKNINTKVNFSDKKAFSKIKVRVKNEIVALRVGDVDVNAMRGEYIYSDKWDEFISGDDVVTIDTRNNYEVREGTFKNSIDPNTDTFRQFPEWIDKNLELLKGKKIAMFCTGGIRCEKSTAYMKQIGFNDVFHLYGGILQYLEDKKTTSTSWVGNCFVFDDRCAVKPDLTATYKLT